MPPKKAKFQYPSPMPLRLNRDGTQRAPISTNTANTYKTCLNRLAAAGYTNQSILIEKAYEVAHYIQQLFPGDDEKTKQKRRLYYSAVFNVLPHTYLARTNAYHEAYSQSRYTAPEMEFVEDERE